MSKCSNPEELLEFPCHYTFKAVGLSGDEFSTQITAAVRRFALVAQDSIQIRPSGKGTYQSVSVVVRLESYQQLINIYAEMKAVAGLKMLL